MNKFRYVSIALGLVAIWSSSLWASGIDTSNPNLPPAGIYLSPSDVHAMYTGGALQIVLSAIQHRPFGPGGAQSLPGTNDEQESFDSTLDGMVSINGGPPQPILMTGPASTVVHNKIGNVTGTFQTEMIQMLLAGSGVMVRESPSLQSLGQTKITSIGGGLYHIDSFFDVFTELSINGGDTWIPSSSSTRVNLVPEPTSILLASLAALAVTVCGLRRRPAVR